MLTLLFVPEALGAQTGRVLSNEVFLDLTRGRARPQLPSPQSPIWMPDGMSDDIMQRGEARNAPLPASSWNLTA